VGAERVCDTFRRDVTCTAYLFLSVFQTSNRHAITEKTVKEKFRSVVHRVVEKLKLKVDVPRVGNPSVEYQGRVGKIDTWSVQESKAGHLHRLWATVRGGKSTLWLASTPEDVQKLLNNWMADAEKSQKREYITLVREASNLLKRQVAGGVTVHPSETPLARSGGVR
jgi:hypothetical protein